MEIGLFALAVFSFGIFIGLLFRRTGKKEETRKNKKDGKEQKKTEEAKKTQEKVSIKEEKKVYVENEQPKGVLKVETRVDEIAAVNANASKLQKEFLSKKAAEEALKRTEEGYNSDEEWVDFKKKKPQKRETDKQKYEKKYNF